MSGVTLLKRQGHFESISISYNEDGTCHGKGCDGSIKGKGVGRGLRLVGLRRNPREDKRRILDFYLEHPSLTDSMIVESRDPAWRRLRGFNADH